jgi:hypothetical protein
MDLNHLWVGFQYLFLKGAQGLVIQENCPTPAMHLVHPSLREFCPRLSKNTTKVITCKRCSFGDEMPFVKNKPTNQFQNSLCFSGFHASKEAR